MSHILCCVKDSAMKDKDTGSSITEPHSFYNSRGVVIIEGSRVYFPVPGFLARSNLCLKLIHPMAPKIVFE